MLEREFEESHAGLGWTDIMFILFKHKRTILVCTGVGVLAALLVHLVAAPAYKSEAKLFVPYVVDRNTVDEAKDVTATSRANDAIINSEVEILTSVDLALKTAAALHQKGVPIGLDLKEDRAKAAQNIPKKIEVAVQKGMNIITVSYRDREPENATRFLQELLRNYREKHLEVHRFPQGFEIIAQRRDEVRKQLDGTETELKHLRNKVQSLSVADSTTTLSAAIATADNALYTAESERVGQEAKVAAMEIGDGGVNLAVARPNELRANEPETQRHRFIVQLLSELRERERSLLATYPPESRMVKIPRKQISELDEQRRSLERRYPELTVAETSNEHLHAQSNLAFEKARLASMIATEEALRTQLQQLQEKREQFSELSPNIARLELDKQVLEESYKNIETSLGKAQDDRAVDWSKISNIASVQEPSPALRQPDIRKNMLMLGLAGGGLALGLGGAFFRELVLDQTIKRPVEFRLGLGLPLLLSIPFTGTSGDRRGKQGVVVRPGYVRAFVQPFCEAIRDRMILSFELRKLNRKPKLIGVAGAAPGAGSSTMASGLAAALSETGDGKVLLVDMNLRDGDVHPFFQGKEAHSLTSILEDKNTPQTTLDNLYLATVDAASTERIPMGVRRFNRLVPSLKAADFDYIIFDMPPLGTTSPTLGMAVFLDKLLLVIESERSNKETVKRFYSELVSSRVDVFCVLNKTRSYGPAWLGGDGY